MAEELKLRRVGVLSPFDEARAEIARWESVYPNAGHIGLVVDAPHDLEVTIAGENLKPSQAAGIFFMAAQTVLE